MRRPPILSAVGALLIAVVLAGCGGGSNTVTVTVDDTGETTDTVVTDTTMTETTVTTITDTTVIDTTETTSTPGGDEPPDMTALDNPPDYDAALKLMQTGTPSTDAKAFFETPGSVFFCDLGLDTGVSGCETQQRLEAPEGHCPGGATPTDVGRIEFTPSGVEPVCNSDTILRPDAPILSPGEIARVSGSPIQCMNVGGAVMCLDTTARTGFWLDPTKYVIL